MQLALFRLFTLKADRLIAFTGSFRELFKDFSLVYEDFKCAD